MAPKIHSVTFAKALGKAVRLEREKQNLSQEKLSFEAEIDRTYMSGIERGVRNPTLKTALRISNALGIKLSKLLEAAEKQI